MLVIPVCLKTLISQTKLFRLFQNESWNLLKSVWLQGLLETNDSKDNL